MIYLNNSNKKIRIPKHQGNGEGSYTLEITNNITGQLIMSKYLPNESHSDHNYIFTNIDWEAFKDAGEYLYKVIDHNRVIETGLITWGNYKREHKSFESENNIIQYDPSNGLNK